MLTPALISIELAVWRGLCVGDAAGDDLRLRVVLAFDGTAARSAGASSVVRCGSTRPRWDPERVARTGRAAAHRPRGMRRTGRVCRRTGPPPRPRRGASSSSRSAVRARARVPSQRGRPYERGSARAYAIPWQASSSQKPAARRAEPWRRGRPASPARVEEIPGLTWGQCITPGQTATSRTGTRSGSRRRGPRRP